MPAADKPVVLHPVVRQLEVGPMRNFTYIFGDREGGEGIVIDPSWEGERIEAEIAAFRLTVRWVINTHSHHDHIGENDRFRRFGIPLVAHRAARTHPDIAPAHGESLLLGALPIRIHHTPGHSPDSICIEAGGYLFTGDTLFVGECGRVDLFGSDPKAMHHSLLSVIGALPDALIVMPGHNYGPAPSRTLGEEKRLNYTLAPRTLPEFLRFMAEP